MKGGSTVKDRRMECEHLIKQEVEPIRENKSDLGEQSWTVFFMWSSMLYVVSKPM